MNFGGKGTGEHWSHCEEQTARAWPTTLHPNSLVRMRQAADCGSAGEAVRVKKGTDPRSRRPRSAVAITDESEIDDQYYIYVITIVDMNVMQLDAAGKFRPKGTMTRAEAVAAFARLLELTGEL